jgi:regulator of sirC expression with transglutaminase-like and TPR domain
MLRLSLSVSVWMLLASGGALPADEKKAPDPAAKTVEQLADSARKSVVVILFPDRDGKPKGLGTGFVVGEGLIATNLHVIGEARPITVQLADGKRHPVTAVHASDRSLDLAVLRIDVKGLTPLELGDSDTLKNGQSVVALGHPRGLEHSVVSGVVSGRPTIEGVPMIQVAIPIESGNSGGPLLDLHGRVQGIVTLRAQLTPNLGFAVRVNALKALLKKPNPIPMTRWVTIGTINPEEWTTVFEGRWRQRNGQITVDGPGSGIGGRSLCLSRRDVPPLPYEVAVAVRLDDESGAGGLVFHADGGDKHYGFYPSNGQLRLSRFEGPDVFNWKVLVQKSSRHYHPGEWNTLKVRVEKDKIRCYVNDQMVIESTDTALTSGKVGLAKFRSSRVEFKQFQLAKEVPPLAPPADLVARITKAVEKLSGEGPAPAAVVDSLLPDAPASQAVLRQRAKQLEQQAVQLRDLAQAVHHKGVLAELERATQGKDSAVDLLQAALLVARLDNEELDVAAYRQQVERMAKEVAATLPRDADEKAKIAALNKYLFEERGFHGSRSDYYNRSNSYLNEVIDDREGLPITLSVLYLELGKRIGLKLEGVGLPGHFVVRQVSGPGKTQLIDVYEGGKPLSRADAERKVQAMTGGPLKEEHLATVDKRAIVVRMLHNLSGIARKEEDAKRLLRYVDAILTVDPDEAEDRMLRTLLRAHLGDRAGAIADADWLLEHEPPGLDRARVLKLRDRLKQADK